MTPREQACHYLQERSIPYELIEHPAVFTIPEMEQLGITDQGRVCKNLFLRDAKGKNHYLITMDKDKRADLTEIAGQLGSTKLSFASAQRLEQYLGLHGGEVTPLGVLNDESATVVVAFDEDLVGEQRLGIHPNDNTATLWMTYDDLKKAVELHGNQMVTLSL